MWFPADGSEEWLSKLDAEICLHLLDSISAKTPELRALEIGVWKGAFATTILMNFTSSTVIGVDPYPNGEEAERILRERIEELQVSPRFELVSSLNQVSREQLFNLIHVDGKHTEKDCLSDLNLASRKLARGGVMVVDDILHPWFPGVTSAFFKFLSNSDFVMFLSTGSKGYICRAPDADNLRAATKGQSNFKTLWETHDGFFESGGGRYPQETDVNDFPVLIGVQKSSAVQTIVSRVRALLGISKDAIAKFWMGRKSRKLS